MEHGRLKVVVATILLLACVAVSGSVAKKPSAKPAKQVPRLVDVGADYCLPCKMMEPILKELAKEYKGRLTVVSINATKNPEAEKKLKVKSYPTQIFYDSKGKELYRHEGFYSKAKILARFKSLGIKLSK